jgi:hypothetical protein
LGNPIKSRAAVKIVATNVCLVSLTTRYFLGYPYMKLNVALAASIAAFALMTGCAKKDAEAPAADAAASSADAAASSADAAASSAAAATDATAPAADAAAAPAADAAAPAADAAAPAAPAEAPKQ